MRLCRRVALLVVASSIFLVSALPASARSGAAAAPPAFGVQVHATWSEYTDAERDEVLDKLRSARVGWVRIDVGWASLQERDGDSFSRWYVDRTDRAVNAARARGLSVLLTLWATPGWANGGAGTNVPPADVQTYARVARWAAEHFRGRVAAWEVWNEPNLRGSFAGSAADYGRLLRAAYQAFKAGDPGVRVVLGGPSANDTKWLADVYAAGAKGSFDVMATHPYQGMADARPETPDDGSIYTLSHVAAVKKLMNKHGDGSKPIWFTEFGWSSHGRTQGMPNWKRGVTPQRQADYLVRTLRYVRARFPYVTHVFWYSERDRNTGDVQFDNYGLLGRDLSPKPAYVALKQFLARPVAGV